MRRYVEVSHLLEAGMKTCLGLPEPARTVALA